MHNPLSGNDSRDELFSNSTIVLDGDRQNALPAVATTVDVAEEEHDLAYRQSVEGLLAMLAQDIAHQERIQKLIIAGGVFVAGTLVYAIMVTIDQRQRLPWW